jgi:hypothetical protein
LFLETTSTSGRVAFSARDPHIPVKVGYGGHKSACPKIRIQRELWVAPKLRERALGVVITSYLPADIFIL